MTGWNQNQHQNQGQNQNQPPNRGRNTGQGFQSRQFGQAGQGQQPQMQAQGSGQGQSQGQGQHRANWGTQPYYGGYGYDFRGEGFGGMAQGYPNPGFGSSGQGLGVDAPTGTGTSRQMGGMTSGHTWQPGPHSGKGPKRTDSRIQDEVSQRLTQHGQLDASNVDVKVNNGEVTLSGTVDSRQAKRTADHVAESVPGVQDVHNQLTIQQGQSQPVH